MDQSSERAIESTNISTYLHYARLHSINYFVLEDNIITKLSYNFNLISHSSGT